MGLQEPGPARKAGEDPIVRAARRSVAVHNDGTDLDPDMTGDPVHPKARMGRARSTG